MSSESSRARVFRAPAASNDGDPRHGQTGQGAEVIDLATRHVLPVVARRQSRTEPLVMVGGLAVIAVLGAVTFWNMSLSRVGQTAARRDLAAPVSPAMRSGVAAAAPMPAFRPMAPVRPAYLPGMPAQPMVQANRAAAPAVVFDAGAMPMAQGALGAAPAAVLPVPGGATANGNDDFAGRLGVAGSGAATASAAFDPGTTVAQGTLIPAVLETAIQTDVPGYARAIVSADVRSFDGTRVLVPRSSRLVGQYRSGLAAGQRRVYVIWTRLIRPDGVAVNLGSPATGLGGEAGLAGTVNTHFFERFGSAMLLTVLGGLNAIGGNASVIIAGGGQSAAAAAVGQTGQIGPTVRVHPGEPVRVFTARDLDFAKVARE
jgi:type IV secretion system protein VirB10